MRIFKRGAGAATPPAEVDILDLQRFGGSWEKVFASLINERHRSLRSANTKDLIAYIRDGTVPSNFVNSQFLQHLSRDQAFVHSNQIVSASGFAEARNVLAVAGNLETVQRGRFGQFFRAQNGWDVGAVLGLVGANTGPPISINDIERVGAEFGWADNALFEFASDLGNRYRWHGSIRQLPGFSEFVRRNIDGWAVILGTPIAGHDFLWSQISGVDDDVLELLAGPICNAATRTPKKVAVAAKAELRKLPVAVANEHLKSIALSAKPAQRANALNELADLSQGDDRGELIAWMNEHLANDRAGAVQEAMAALVENAEESVAKPELPSVDLPEVADLRTERGVSIRNVESLLAVVNARSSPQQWWGVTGVLYWLAQQSPSTLLKLNRFHVARALLVHPGQLRYAPSNLLHEAIPMPSLLELSAVAAEDGQSALSVVHVVVHMQHVSPWSGAELVDLFELHAETLIDVLEHRESSYAVDRGSLLSLFEVVERRPAKVDRALVAAVVGGYKGDREQLQRIVGPDRVDEVVAYLASKKRAERIGAAEWIRKHAPGTAVAALLVATRREKDDGAKAAMLAALEVLGEDLDEFLGADALLADAKKALARKNAIPKAIDWLDVDALPLLEWADGSPVAREIVKWFVVMAVKSKSAEPSPILRRHFDNMEPERVRIFGSTVLDTWMAEDLRTFTEDEALAQATQQAPHHLRWSQSGHGRHPGLTLQQITDALLVDARKQIAGSATSSKGLLALAAAAAGPEVSDRTLAYIRKHRGQRVHQAKVLLEMLAWIDEPATVQAVMSVATRFRPKGIQNEAQKQAELLAERHGWTLDDLADRSVPDGGFDVDGRLVFDYGERTFTAHLNDDLTIRLVNEGTGKVVRSLPAGRADEDADHIKGIKSDFSAAKKELKSTLAIQPNRLHAAMCVQRIWSPDDFRRYFVDHPVMNRLATRLIWLSAADDVTATFRPLSDGTLISVDDDDVDLDSNAEISLAHEQLVDPGLGVRWQTHMSDYEIAPLFGQFGRPAVASVEGQTKIVDFVGHGHNDGSLRGQMNRQAWQLGVPQDGGVAHEIVKDVPTANLTGVIEILGGLPAAAYDIGSWSCFLGEMYFVPSGAQYISNTMAVPFDTVPPVLLTEFYAEAQAIALGGSGFDPAHDKKW